MRLAPSLLCLTALLAGGPALAQAGGFPGSTIGLPADPFASNYPSAPPPREIAPDPRVEGRPRRAVRARRPAPRSRGLRPPADVPYR